MPGGIYLRRGDELIEMSEQQYPTEAELQRLLANHPDLLTADGEPHRWVLVAREFGIAAARDASDRWSVDHLFIDEGGVPTLVEVKRSTDTRIRREVVGQMLDYAANALSHWSVEAISARFEAAHDDPAEALAQALGSDVDPDAFWDSVANNLSARSLRLVFVADEIPSELRAIVEFLNEQMTNTEVLAVEVRQYVDVTGEHQTLVPRMIGQTQAARRAKGRGVRVGWDERSWLAAFRDARGDTQADVAARLLEWAQHDAGLTVAFGTGAKNPGARVALAEVPLFTVYRGYSDGYVEVPFAGLSTRPPFDAATKRHELRERLVAIPAVAIADDQLAKYPSFPVATLSHPSSFARFVQTVEWTVRALRAASNE